MYNSSSPRVQHPSFLFGSTSESSLTQTGGLAMGMTEEGKISRTGPLLSYFRASPDLEIVCTANDSSLG